MTSYNFWIYQHKLLGILRQLAEDAGVSFGQQDQKAVLRGLLNSESSSNTFFEYAFFSKDDLTVCLARDSDDGNIIHLKIQSRDPDFLGLGRRLEIFQSHFSDRPPDSEH